MLPIDVSADRARSPEQKLMAAVLRQALDDLHLTRVYRGKTGLSEVEAWFREDEGRWPFSFSNVCTGLGLDARMIREALSRDARRCEPR